MGLRLVLVDTEDERFMNPAPLPSAGVDATELDMVVDFYNGCLSKYLDKSPRYKRAWKALGASGNLVRILSKTERLKNMYWGKSEAELCKLAENEQGFLNDLEDNLLDLPNLCAFMRANAWTGNSHG